MNQNNPVGSMACFGHRHIVIKNEYEASMTVSIKHDSLLSIIIVDHHLQPSYCLPKMFLTTINNLSIRRIDHGSQKKRLTTHREHVTSNQTSVSISNTLVHSYKGNHLSFATLLNSMIKCWFPKPSTNKFTRSVGLEVELKSSPSWKLGV